MNAAADPCLILLAAGQSRRFGTPKQLARVAGEPLLRRAARNALGTGLPVIVVLGARADAVRCALDDLPVEMVLNTGWSNGLGGSIACGVRRAQLRRPHCSGVLLCLADQPLVDTAELERLLRAHRESPRHIICADHGSVRGPPCLFPRPLFAALANLRGTQGARSLLRLHADNIVVVAMPEAAFDIDTREDLARAQMKS